MVLNKKNINLVTIVALLIFYLVIFIFNETFNIINIINICIPIVGLVFILFDKNMSIFYALVCLLITAFGGEANFAGAIFCFMSVYDDRSTKIIWINIVVIIIGFGINSFSYGYLTLYPLAMMLAFLFVFAHMYIRFWKGPETIVDEDYKKYLEYKKTLEKEKSKKGLTPEQMKTISMLLQGYKHKEASEILNIERATYTTRISILKTRYDVISDFQLALSLIEDDVIGKDDITYVKMKHQSNTK